MAENEDPKDPIGSFLRGYKRVLEDYHILATSGAVVSKLPTIEQLEAIIKKLTDQNKIEIEKTINSLKSTVDTMLSRLNYVLTAIGLAIFIGGIAFTILNFIVKTVDKPPTRTTSEYTIYGDTSKPHVDYIDKDGKRNTLPLVIPSPEYNPEVHK